MTNHIPDRWSFYDRKPSGDGPRRGREWGPGRSRNTLDKSAPTIAQRLKQAGYRTGFVGKWHLAGPDWRTEDASMFPEAYGFDVNVAGNAMGGPGTFFAPINMPNYQAGEAGDYLPDLLAQEAVDFVAAPRPEGEPFFLCLWTYTVHYPIEATPELWRATPTSRSPTSDALSRDGRGHGPRGRLRARRARAAGDRGRDAGRVHLGQRPDAERVDPAAARGACARAASACR